VCIAHKFFEISMESMSIEGITDIIYKNYKKQLELGGIHFQCEGGESVEGNE